MLSEEQLDVLSGALVPLYQHLEAWVIADVARRIRNTMMYTRTAELEVQALQKLGYSPARIRAEVMRILRADKAFQKQVEENTLHFKREVAAKLAEITAAAQKAGAEVVSSAGEMSWKDDISLWDSAGVDLKEDGTLKQITKAMTDQTKGELKNLTRTTGFRTASGMEPVKEVYQKELDKALVKVSGGAVTKEQCVREVVRDLARSGLRTIDYDSGRSYQLDTASRMCVNTAAGQLAAQVCNSNIQKTEVTLVQVSAHWGARDKGEGVKNHKEWQGKVYSIDGQLHPEEEKRIGMEIRDLQECTGYSVQEGSGDIEGLHGVNCRHNHHPFFEGISTPVKYDPEPEAKEINGRMYSYYDMTQGMRRREREIRALKREKEALDTLGEDAAEVRAKIRQKTNEYNSFCDECGLRRKPERLRVESGTSDLTKTEAWKAYDAERERKVNDARFSESFIELNNGQKDVITMRKLRNNLNHSTIGKECVEYLEKHPELRVHMCYQVDNPESLYGQQDGDDIFIYASDTKTVQKTAEILIHEVTHHKFNIGGNQRAEVICKMQEIRHRNRTDQLTADELRGIIKSVKAGYPELNWR